MQDIHQYAGLLLTLLCLTAFLSPSLIGQRKKNHRKHVYSVHTYAEEGKIPEYEEQSPLTFQLPSTTSVVTKETPSTMGWWEREREACWGVKAKTTFKTTLCHVIGFWVPLHSWFIFCHYKDGEKEKEIPWVYLERNLKHMLPVLCDFIIICTGDKIQGYG